MTRRKSIKLKGNIQHSVCRWCYGKVRLDDLCAAGKEMGLVAIDLLNPPEFGTARKHGLAAAGGGNLRRVASGVSRAGLGLAKIKINGSADADNLGTARTQIAICAQPVP